MMLSMKKIGRRASLVMLFGILPLTVCGQDTPSSPQTASGVLLYAPGSNLERIEVETLRQAKVSVDVAMYSFTDRELAEELARLARNGMRARVYRDRAEYFLTLVQTPRWRVSLGSAIAIDTASIMFKAALTFSPLMEAVSVESFVFPVTH